MPHLFIILLKINLVLLLFAATYYFVLRRLTFYVLNRCFLALGIVFSTAYPFIDLTDFFYQQEVKSSVATYLPQLNQKAAELVPTGFFINNWPILSALFYLGVLVMTIRLAFQFISLYKIHRKSNPSTVANYKVRTLDESVSPFSFWQTIYVNPSLHNEKELNTILAHEMVHVKQWHSVDIILAELSVVFYWFNPGVWLMKKAVKENLEFITDQKILKKGMDRKAYQYSLLGVGQLNTSVAIVNNFNLSDLKKRIKMMNVKRSSKLTLSRYAFALPVLLLTTLAFTISKKEVKAHLPTLSKIIPQLAVEEAQSVKEVKSIAKTKRKKVVEIIVPSTVEKKDTVFKISHFVRTVFIKNDTTTTQPSVDDIKLMLAGLKEKLNLSTEERPTVKGKVGQVFVFKKDTVDLTKKGEAKKLSITISANGKFQEDHVAANEKDKTVTIRAFKIGDTSLAGGGIDYTVNGKISSSEDLNKLNPNEIQSVNVVKNALNSRAKIHIETKKKAEQ